MKPSGAPDPLYVAARRGLLDALEAVSVHLDAVVLVGAQAVYVHAGESDLQVAPYTTDADIALDPNRRGSTPLIEDALGQAGFSRASKNDVGAWTKMVTVNANALPIVVDLLVPDSVGGPGKRGARIPPHDKMSARKVVGLEGALVDRDIHSLLSLEEMDTRAFEIAVAGPAALLVAKAFKIAERAGDVDRRRDKDALDVLRLLQASATADLVRRFGRLESESLSRGVSEEGIRQLEALFGTPSGPGCQMAARAAAPFEAEDTIRASAAALTNDLLRELGKHGSS